MSYRLEFSLLGLPKGLNGAHQHWAVKAKDRRKWREEVFVMCIGKKPAKPLKKCAIQCTRISTGKMDHDNRVASFKPVIDGLIDAGIIIDDNDEVIVKREYPVEKGKPGRIRIIVIEVTE